MLFLLQQVTVLLVLITAQSAHSATIKEFIRAPQVCQTSECLALSALITTNMNLTANPCEDFNAYACGNYDANTLYDPASVTWSRNDEPMVMQSGVNSVSNKLIKRVFELLYSQGKVRSKDPDVNAMYKLSRDLFRSCSSWLKKRSASRFPGGDQKASQIFFDGVLTHLLDSIDRKALNGSFERALAKMVRFSVWPMIKVGPSFKMLMGKASAQSNISRVSLVSNTHYPSSPNFTIYTQYFSTLSAASNLRLDNPEEFSEIVRELDFRRSIRSTREQDLKKWENCSEAVDFLDVAKSDFTIGELDILSECADPENPFSWTEFFEGVLDGNVGQDTPIELRRLSNANGIISLVNYFKKRAFVSAVDGKYSNHFSFLITDWLFTFAPFFPAHVATQWKINPLKRSFMPSLEGDPIDSCMVLTKILLGPVIERMYQKAYHADTFDKVQNLAEVIQNATIRNVRRQKWITQSSKEAIVDKIVSLQRDIGFQVFSDQQMKTFYASTIRALKRGNYTRSYENFGMLFSLAMCASAGKENNLLSSYTPESAFTSISGLAVNAFSFTSKNQIVFPMGILAPSLYHRSYPDYMNLGGIGVVIGHEIGHGFDNMGHELTKLGIRGHFWDNVTEAEYLKRMDCVMSRFAKYELVPGQLHNANETVGNDISDLMGIQSAFGAMKLMRERGQFTKLPNLHHSLTPERLFFVQAAQTWCTKTEPAVLTEMFEYSTHSPPHIRIRGMMENSRDFARVFKCKQGQAMNPPDKCEFW